MNLVTQNLIDAWNKDLETMSAPDRIGWAHDNFGSELVMSTSFGIQAALLLHMATRVDPGIPVIFVDTGYLFHETYIFAHSLSQQLNLNLKKYHPLMSSAEQEALYGKLWESGLEGLEQYNFIRKIEPMNRALSELKASVWMAGLRRQQSSTRQSLPIIQRQNKMLKFHPIVDWSQRDVYQYLVANDLPYHPLWEKGYVSVGDAHSSRPLEAGMSEEDTRFGGIKRECGLHELSNRMDFQI